MRRCPYAEIETWAGAVAPPPGAAPRDVARHKRLAVAARAMGRCIVDVAPPGPGRDAALNLTRLATLEAQAALGAPGKEDL